MHSDHEAALGRDDSMEEAGSITVEQSHCAFDLVGSFGVVEAVEALAGTFTGEHTIGVDLTITDGDHALVTDYKVVISLVEFCMFAEDLASCQLVAVDVKVATF